MMTRCFNIFSIANAVGRAVMSATPPGGNATTIVMGRDGYASCANTGTGRSATATNAIRRRIFFLRVDVLFSGTIIGARAPGVKRRRRLCDPIEFPSDHEPARDRYLHRFLLGRGKPRGGAGRIGRGLDGLRRRFRRLSRAPGGPARRMRFGDPSRSGSERASGAEASDPAFRRRGSEGRRHCGACVSARQGRAQDERTLMSAVLRPAPSLEPMSEADLRAVIDIEERLYDFPWTL